MKIDFGQKIRFAFVKSTLDNGSEVCTRGENLDSTQERADPEQFCCPMSFQFVIF
jgi:hypothetical protein